MQLRFEQLSSHLNKQLARIYLLHGDEPLLLIEGAQAIRDAATKAGFADREVMVADQGFDWDTLLAATQSMSLFGSRRILDLRLPTGKPGTEGAKVLEAVGNDPSPDNVLLVSSARLDKSAMNSEWFSALETAGAAIAIYPLERNELPQWTAQALSR